jgi:hypothetical protein
MSAKTGEGSDTVVLYPCPCGCGERFGTGIGAALHAINKEDGAHAGVSCHNDAYEAFTARFGAGGSL